MKKDVCLADNNLAQICHLRSNMKLSFWAGTASSAMVEKQTCKTLVLLIA
jgi:hypothetical protein